MLNAPRRNRDLYLDLLARTILNQIYRDPSQFPGQIGVIDDTLREEGRDWPLVAHSMIGAKRMANLRQAVETVIREGVPGHLMETGVWRGGATILMRGILRAYAENDRKVFVADSFEGLPPPELGGAEADIGDLHHTVEQLAIGKEEVEDNFRRYGLLDEQVVFVKGFFEHTLPGLETGPLAVLRLDGDMYSSTMVALENLYPRVSPGGFLIVDDYGAVEGCRKAVDDYRLNHGINAELNRVDWTGAYWRKPGGTGPGPMRRLRNAIGI